MYVAIFEAIFLLLDDCALNTFYEDFVSAFTYKVHTFIPR